MFTGIIINTFDCSAFSDYFVLNELTYSEEPTRALDGTMSDLSKIQSFIVPRIFVDFNFLDIAQYRQLLQATSTKEFPITYYDPDNNETKTAKFYLKPVSRSKLYVKPTSDGMDVRGVRNLSLEFVATLRDDIEDVN